MKYRTRKQSAQLEIDSLPWARKIIEEQEGGVPNHSEPTVARARRIVLEAATPKGADAPAGPTKSRL